MSSPEHFSPSTQRETQPLTPLAQRLLGALRHLAKEHDELAMPVRGFEKYMRRNPLSDEDIKGGLEMVRDYIDVVLTEDAQPTNASVIA